MLTPFLIPRFPLFRPILHCMPHLPENVHQGYPTFLEHGASTNILDSDGQYALHSAAFHTDQIELIEMLLQHGADPNALNSAGQTALEISLERGNTSTASCLRAAVTAHQQ